MYFGNSGAEAIEAAVKLARLNRGDGSRRRIITLTNSFHGRTMGSLSLTGKPALREDFEPLLPGVEHIETTIEALEATIDETGGGPGGRADQGRGRRRRSARRLSREGAGSSPQQHGVLLILDEIQTGIGRTGSWFAFQQHGIVPDAIALAKGIAGGVPIGALVTFGAASDLFKPGQHGSTFGGNPLAAAAGNAVIGEIERAGLVENARVRGDELRRMIADLDSPLIEETRGAGLLIGIGLTEPVAPRLAAAALDRGLIINAPNESSIRLAPPLIVGDTELAEFRGLFTSALEAIS